MKALKLKTLIMSHIIRVEPSKGKWEGGREFRRREGWVCAKSLG